MTTAPKNAAKAEQIEALKEEKTADNSHFSREEIENIVSAKFSDLLQHAKLDLQYNVDDHAKALSDEVANAIAKLAESGPLAKAVADFFTDPENVKAVLGAGTAGLAVAPPVPATQIDPHADDSAAFLRKRQQDAEAKARAKADAEIAKVRDNAANKAREAYEQLHDPAVSSVITAEEYQAIDGFRMRAGDGGTFHPDFDVGIAKGELSLSGSRVILSKDVDLPSSLPPFTATEFFLLAGGKMMRSEVIGGIAFGGERDARLKAGTLAFALAPTRGKI